MMGGTSLDQQTGWLVESCKICCDFNRNTVSTDQIKIRFLTGVSKVSKTGKDNVNPGFFKTQTAVELGVPLQY